MSFADAATCMRTIYARPEHSTEQVLRAYRDPHKMLGVERLSSVRKLAFRTQLPVVLPAVMCRAFAERARGCTGTIYQAHVTPWRISLDLITVAEKHFWYLRQSEGKINAMVIQSTSMLAQSPFCSPDGGDVWVNASRSRQDVVLGVADLSLLALLPSFAPEPPSLPASTSAASLATQPQCSSN